jgi:hypothetical protein
MLELFYLLTIGVISSSNSLNDYVTNLMIEPLEQRMQTPHKKQFDKLFEDFGFTLNEE